MKFHESLLFLSLSVRLSTNCGFPFSTIFPFLSICKLKINELPPEIILWSGLISGVTFAWLKWWGGLRVDEATEDMGMDAKSHSPPKAEECAMGKKLGEDVEMLGD